MNQSEPLTLLQLNRRIETAVASDAGLRDVWVTAETVDMRVSGGHCYMELIDKDPDSGKPLARLRAIIWASSYGRLNAEFRAATGQNLQSDLKVMVRVTVNFHTAFGLSAVISDINPDYTCGDMLRRRRMMIERLTAEGIIDMNRTLPLSATPCRIAVISAKGAAGYGDFITHLFGNARRLRFSVSLFPAVLQGENAPASIIDALDRVARDIDSYDCVVIIRGGGATGDLASFDNYDLAANIAQFPLPVIVGIGHERDVTLLDYVAAVRVKTPTAAAEWLIDRMSAALDNVRRLGDDIFRAVSDRVGGSLRQLAYYQGLLPSLVSGQLMHQRQRIGHQVTDLLVAGLEAVVSRQKQHLDSVSRLLDALSPEAVLRRGYSITRVGGRAVVDSDTLTHGETAEITLAKGSFTATIKTIEHETR